MDLNKVYLKKLVFEGGGVLGVAYCGALEELSKEKMISTVNTYAGTSAGSIIASLLACGADHNFLINEVFSVDMNKFTKFSYLGGAYSLITKYGLCSGKELEQWLGSLLYKLTGNENITFIELFNKSNKKLIITGTNLKKRQVEYFDHINTPDMQIKLAMRISASIPFLFIPVSYNDALYVDGGVLENFPFKACDICGNEETDTQDILGMILVNDKSDVDKPITGLWSFIKSFVGCYVNQLEENTITGDDWKQSIKISCGKVSSMDFSITDKVKNELIANGKNSMR